MAIVHLTFDLEEFDTPLEFGASIAWEEMINISRQGTANILRLIDRHNVPSTFFTTYHFARETESLIQAIVRTGSEIASHGIRHGEVTKAELTESRQQLSDHFGIPIHGFRAPRMEAHPIEDVKAAGYLYDSSLNPTFIPGRYNKLTAPRKIHKQDGLWVVPASVTPIFRIPLFWLSFHNFPLSVFLKLCDEVLRRDQYVVLYFHPWEFANISSPALKLPFYITRNSGDKMVERLNQLIVHLKESGHVFLPIRSNPIFKLSEENQLDLIF